MCVKGLGEEHVKCLECPCIVKESVEHLLTCPMKEAIRRSMTESDEEFQNLLNEDPRKILHSADCTTWRGLVSGPPPIFQIKGPAEMTDSD